MGLLAMLNNEIETNEYAKIESLSVDKKDPKWWIAVVLGFAGLFFGIAIANAQRQQPIIEKSRQDLRNTITKNLTELNMSAENLSNINDEIAQIKTVIPDLNFHGINSNNELSLQIVSGLNSVIGKGIEIEINDAPKTDALETDDVSLARVYDSDIQLLVNALWASGAESISINDGRLTTTSAIRSAGDAILVNYRPLLPPFVISAIGSQEMMSKLLDHPDYKDLVFVVKTYGLSFKLTDKNEILIPATGVGLPDMQGITVGERS